MFLFDPGVYSSHWLFPVANVSICLLYYGIYHQGDVKMIYKYLYRERLNHYTGLCKTYYLSALAYQY